ncbi:MAG TPA: AAA family ATPase, partial [Thermaerobacter sp.]
AFDEALAVVDRGRADGVGFVLGDGWVALDLDGCRDPLTGSLEPWAEAIVRRLDTYTEVSPSGKGLKLILRSSKSNINTQTIPIDTFGREQKAASGGKTSGRSDRKHEVRLLATAGYTTVTGRRLPGTPSEPMERTAELEALLAEASLAVGHDVPSAPPMPERRELLREAGRALRTVLRNAPNKYRLGKRLRALLSPEYTDDRSGAAFALACFLAEGGVRDPLQIACVVVLSEPHREKFENRPDRWEDAWRCAVRAADKTRAGDKMQGPRNGLGEVQRHGLIEFEATELQKLALEESDDQTSLPFLGVSGYIIEGWSHLVAGLPKAGKTETIFASVMEWLRLGYKVLWLTEESKKVWVERLRRNIEIPPGLRIVFGLGTKPDVLLERAASGDEQVVIVDTIRHLAGIRDEADNAEIARVIGAWEAALKDKTRIYVHHLRKDGGDHGLAVAGGTMLVGAVDRVLQLEHDPNDSRRRRVVKVISRISDMPDLLIGLDENGRPIALGDRSAVELESLAESVLAVLEEAALEDEDGEGWLTTRQVRDRLDEPKPSKEQVLRALNLLRQRGEVDRDPPEGGERKTHRWRRCEKGGWAVIGRSPKGGLLLRWMPEEELKAFRRRGRGA